MQPPFWLHLVDRNLVVTVYDRSRSRCSRLFGGFGRGLCRFILLRRRDGSGIEAARNEAVESASEAGFFRCRHVYEIIGRKQGEGKGRKWRLVSARLRDENGLPHLNFGGIRNAVGVLDILNGGIVAFRDG